MRPCSAISRPWVCSTLTLANVRSIIARSNASGAGADRRIRCWRLGRAQTTADTESLASFTGKVPSNKPRKNYEPKFTGQFKGQGGAEGVGRGRRRPGW